MFKKKYGFKVKNNLFGKLFMWYLRKYCFNYEGFTMRGRGRGKNRREVSRKYKYPLNHTKDIRLAYAERICYYIDKKKVKKAYVVGCNSCVDNRIM